MCPLPLALPPRRRRATGWTFRLLVKWPGDCNANGGSQGICQSDARCPPRHSRHSFRPHLVLQSRRDTQTLAQPTRHSLRRAPPPPKCTLMSTRVPATSFALCIPVRVVGPLHPAHCAGSCPTASKSLALPQLSTSSPGHPRSATSYHQDHHSQKVVVAHGVSVVKLPLTDGLPLESPCSAGDIRLRAL